VADPLEPMRNNMKAFYRLLGTRAPGGSAVERDGLVAAIVPSCPNQSVVNGAVYADGDALRAARAELEQAYRDAGVRTWRVWVEDRDTETAAWLERSGHTLAVAPRAMTVDLPTQALGDDGDLECRRGADGAVLATLNEQAYGLPAGEFSGTIERFSGSPVQMYFAYQDGEPAAGLLTVDEGGDCGVYCVATRPASRGAGLATGLMRRALREARERGCATSSLQSSDAGYPIYRRLGYEDRCAIQVWEQRVES